MYAGNRRMRCESFLAMPRRLGYHHPRHLLMNLQVLDRLASRPRREPELIGRAVTLLWRSR